MRANQVTVFRTASVLLILGWAVGSCAPFTRPQPRAAATARITFLSDPEGAVVRLNGVELPGTTPILNADIEPGFVEAEFHLEGYEPLRVQRTFEPGIALRLDVHLVPRPIATPTPTATPTETPSPTATPGRARVTIITEPPGATVYVDGTTVPGTTPLTEIELGPGSHTFRLELPGREPVVLERNWPRGGPQTLRVSLEAAPATVTFTTDPPGATVTINDVALEGVTPIESVSLPAEKSRIVFSKEGHAVQEVTRIWQPGMIDYVDVDLEVAPATVSLFSEPAGATITIDGREIGQTNLEGVRLPAGETRITFTLDGYESVSLGRTWAPSEVDRVEVVLFPNTGKVRIDSSERWDRLEIDGEAVTASPGEPIPLLAGRHFAHAVRGDETGEIEFEIEAGQDISVGLAWKRWQPDPEHFVHIPAGTASLGDERFGQDNPPRQVAAKEIWIARTEVTIDEYAQCVAAGKCAPAGTDPYCNAGAEGRGRHPVNCVSAGDARAYVVWLEATTGLPHRLPTCEEWERSARVGGRFPWGDDEPEGRCNSCDKQCPFAHFRNEAVDDGHRTTAPVASMATCRSPQGVFDQIGNVAEWCIAGRDAAGRRQYEVRGGSWGQVGVFLEPAFAGRRDEGDRDATIGFRVVVPRPDWM